MCSSNLHHIQQNQFKAENSRGVFHVVMIDRTVVLKAGIPGVVDENLRQSMNESSDTISQLSTL